MGIKRVCDRCGKDVPAKGKKFKLGSMRYGSDHPHLLVSFGCDFAYCGSSIDRDYDLCFDCYCKLKAWLNDPNKYLEEIDETQQD